jgi:hypothetical protein
MSDKNKVIGKIIVFSVIFLIIGGVGGYLIGEHSSKGYANLANFRGENANFSGSNFQINNTVRAEITSFFDSTQDNETVNSYCQNNPGYCMEYCRTINPSDIRCEELIANFRGGMPAR